MVKEATTAIAVLALYILVLLAPLHQAAGLQRDLDTLGYSSLDLWTICVPNTQDDGTKPVDVAKCPATGIGKQDIALAGPDSIDLDPPAIATEIDYPLLPAPSQGRRLPSVAQARAPPVTV